MDQAATEVARTPEQPSSNATERAKRFLGRHIDDAKQTVLGLGFISSGIGTLALTGGAADALWEGRFSEAAIRGLAAVGTNSLTLASRNSMTASNRTEKIIGSLKNLLKRKNGPTS